MPRPLATFTAGALAALLLSGCGSGGQGNWNEYLQVMRQGIGSSIRPPSVTMEQAAAIPYASLGFRLDDGAEGLLVLATENGGDTMWTSAARIVLEMRDGRVLRSVGLVHDRQTAAAGQGAGLPSLAQALRGPLRSTRLIDMPDMGAYGVRLDCVAAPRGPQMVRILGVSLATVRVDETCRSTNPNWTFTDSFWLDAQTSFVWQSVQHLHPSGGRLQIRILRPPE